MAVNTSDDALLIGVNEVVKSPPSVKFPDIDVAPVDEATVNLSTAEPFCILKFLDALFKV